MKNIFMLIILFGMGLNAIAQVCGPLDATFGTNGKSFGLSAGPGTGVGDSKILTLADGKIIQVAALQNYNGYNTAFVMIRYNAGGSIDGTFGAGGKSFFANSINNEYIEDAVAQADGKIVAVGYSYSPYGADLMLLRLKSNGNLDSSFGINGKVINSLSIDYDFEYVQSIAFQPDGKIIIAATITARHHLCQNQSIPYPQGVIMRYNVNGSIDNSFGKDGKVIITNGNYQDRASSVVVDPNGKISVAVTSSYDCNCEEDYYGGFFWNCRKSLLMILRLKADGSTDSSFAKNGVSIDSIAVNQEMRLLLQPDGKFVVMSGSQNGFIVIRYKNDGTRDNGFGVEGKVFTRVDGDYYYQGLSSAVIQANGKIVLGGNFNDNNSSSMLVVRYNTDGSLDNHFFTNGIAKFRVGPINSYESVTGLASQGAALIVGGYMQDGLSSNLVLTRIQDPSLNSLGSIITLNGPASFCYGSNVTLSSNTQGGLQWYRNGVAINDAWYSSYKAEQSGVYSLLVNNAGVCGISDTVVVTVHSNPLPDIYAAGDVNFCEGGSVVLSSSNTETLQWFKNGTSINGATALNYTATESGSYLVTATDQASCSGSSQPVIVTVRSSALPIITWSGDTNICEGDLVVLTTSDPSDGRQWYKDGAPISGANLASYTANISGSYTESNGCKTSDPVVVTTRPKPPKPSIDWNGTTLSTNSGYASYQWLLDGSPIAGATNISYLPGTVNGIFKVQVKDATNCINVSNDFNKVVTGIADIMIGDTRLRYYPNPTSKTLYLELTQQLNKKLVAEIYDLNGRLLQSQNLDHGRNEISVEELSTGLYGLIINDGKERTVRKLMIVK